MVLSQSWDMAVFKANTWWSWRTQPRCTTSWSAPFAPVIHGPSSAYHPSGTNLPYRSRAVIDPRGILREFGLTIDENVEVRVWDSTAELRYLVLPERPAGSDEWNEQKLAALVTRNAMIGVAKIATPAQGDHS